MNSIKIVEVQRNNQLLILEAKVTNLPSYYCGTTESPCFSFCGGRWRIKLLYNTNDQSNFRLFKSDGMHKTLNVTVSYKKTNGGLKKFSEEFWSENFWDVEKFCSQSIVLPFTFIVEMEVPGYVGDKPKDDVKLLDEERISSEKEAMKEMQSSLRNLLKSGEDCDVVIKVQSKKFQAHRSILRARSPVFHAMFAHDMVEKQKGAVTMEDCNPENFPHFLEHIYTGSVSMISAKNVFSLFESSDKYDLKMLKKECTKFIKKNMTVASFCTVITLGVRHNEKELIDSATEFFCRNSVDIVKTPEWQVFLHENTTVGNELLIKLLSKHESIFRNST